MSITGKNTSTAVQLCALVGLRVDLIDMATRLKKRLNGSRGQFCQERGNNLLGFIQKNIDDLGAEIVALAKQNDAISKRADIIASLPGIDKNTALIVAVDMPWVGKLDSKLTDGLGSMPYTKETGAYISGTNITQRRELYVAALEASQSNLKIKAFYDKQIKAGKNKDDILIDVMHKLIIIINAMLRKGAPWVDVVATDGVDKK